MKGIIFISIYIIVMYIVGVVFKYKRVTMTPNTMLAFTTIPLVVAVLFMYLI